MRNKITFFSQNQTIITNIKNIKVIPMDLNYHTFNWYSFRHSYITMRLSAGVPLPTVAANTDTSMKYIQEHYFHYRADESTEILVKGRKIKPTEENLRWIGSS